MRASLVAAIMTCAALGLALPGCPRTEGIMAPGNFCEALQDNDRVALKALIDPQLATLDVKADSERNFQAFSKWLETHECVESVAIEPGVLRSDPPIKEFTVTFRTAPAGSARRAIGIRLAPKRYEFNLK